MQLFQVNFSKGTFLFPSRAAAEKYYPLANFIERCTVSRNGVEITRADAVLNLKNVQF